MYPVSVLNDTSQTLYNAVANDINTGGYDLAICDFVQSALRFRNVYKVPTILFQHNVESHITRHHFNKVKFAISRLCLWLRWEKGPAIGSTALSLFRKIT